MLGIFEVVALCLFSLFAGAFGTLLVRFVIEIHLIDKDIDELKDKLEENRKKREQIEQNIKRLDELLKGEE